MNIYAYAYDFIFWTQEYELRDGFLIFLPCFPSVCYMPPEKREKIVLALNIQNGLQHGLANLSLSILC
jgi:hypothetical protein